MYMQAIFHVLQPTPQESAPCAFDHFWSSVVWCVAHERERFRDSGSQAEPSQLHAPVITARREGELEQREEGGLVKDCSTSPKFCASVSQDNYASEVKLCKWNDNYYLLLNPTLFEANMYIPFHQEQSKSIMQLTRKIVMIVYCIYISISDCTYLQRCFLA